MNLYIYSMHQTIQLLVSSSNSVFGIDAEIIWARHLSFEKWIESTGLLGRVHETLGSVGWRCWVRSCWFLRGCLRSRVWGLGLLWLGVVERAIGSNLLYVVCVQWSTDCAWNQVCSRAWTRNMCIKLIGKFTRSIFFGSNLQKHCDRDQNVKWDIIIWLSWSMIYLHAHSYSSGACCDLQRVWGEQILACRIYNRAHGWQVVTHRNIL